MNLVVETLSDGSGRCRVVEETSRCVIAEALPPRYALAIVEAWRVLKPYEAALADALKGAAS